MIQSYMSDGWDWVGWDGYHSVLINATNTRNVDNIILKKHPITRKNVDALVNIVLNVEVLLQRPRDKLAKEDLSLTVAEKDHYIKDFYQH